MHTHPCDTCGAPAYCDGDQEQNYDGWPLVICRLYDQPDGQRAPMECDDCAAVEDEGDDDGDDD